MSPLQSIRLAGWVAAAVMMVVNVAWAFDSDGMFSGRSLTLVHGASNDQVQASLVISNGTQETLHGLFVTEQLSPGLFLEPVSISIGGVELTNVSEEVSWMGAVWEEAVPHRWVIEDPATPDSARTLAPGGVAVIVYRIAADSAGVGEWQQFSWAGAWEDGTNTTFGCSEAADLRAIAFPLTDDADGDGLPNDWEMACGLEPLDSADAGGDGDHDGANNLQEYLAGTNPNNPVSVFKLSAFGVTEGGCQVMFTASSNRVYTVQFSPDLTTGVWQAVTNIPSEPVERSVQILDQTSATNAARYYRVEGRTAP